MTAAMYALIPVLARRGARGQAGNRSMTCLRARKDEG
jgi:hypothetical protein